MSVRGQRHVMPSLLLTKVRQRFTRDSIPDVERAVRVQSAWNDLKILPGARIAVAVGSRGIANLQRIVRATVDELREKGAQPFIIPAMGSHGGATADGQRELLAAFGVTERTCGCPVQSSMEVVSLPRGRSPVELFMDRHAHEADGIVLINRIKPHTDFHGRYESGLVKMAVIGLGKERQALAIHQHGTRGLREFVPQAAREILAGGKILLGLGIIENAYDETMRIEVITGGDILEREPELLELARRNMPRLPVDTLDVLIVDQLGKNISGTGMDTNVIGRIRIPGEPEPDGPRIANIVVTDLTEESHGNATGMGLADVMTRRLFEKVNFPVTYKNIFTSSFLERGKMPVVAETDARALEYALRASGPVPNEGPRIIRIRDTLHLGELFVSEATLSEVQNRNGIEVLGEAIEALGADGSLVPFC